MKARSAKSVAIVGVAAIGLGVFLLRFSYLDAADSNWLPVSLPAPSPGASAAGDFYLNSGGRFDILALVPIPENQQISANDPTVSCRFLVDVSGPRGFRARQAITHLVPTQNHKGLLAYYAPGIVQLPRSGTYHFIVRSSLMPPLFVQQNAMIQLERLAPASYGIVYAFATGVAYVLFALAALLITAPALQSTHANPHD